MIFDHHKETRGTYDLCKYIYYFLIIFLISLTNKKIVIYILPYFKKCNTI
jgi:hypothetical protein